ncbi:hypothetical protein P8631_07635, partial [Guyparkeria sp. 1SP6A2]|nr:hypothetical protein [Guyparkeria sp. 1SP6A2]
MNRYDFTLTYAIPDELDVSLLENRLYEAGCDDALSDVPDRGDGLRVGECNSPLQGVEKGCAGSRSWT